MFNKLKEIKGIENENRVRNWHDQTKLKKNKILLKIKKNNLMDGLRAEKVHPKRISKLTEIIQNNVQKDRNY